MQQPTGQRSKAIRRHRSQRTQAPRSTDVVRGPTRQLFDASQEIIIEQPPTNELSNSDQPSEVQERQNPRRSIKELSLRQSESVKPSISDVKTTDQQSSAANSELAPPYEFLTQKNAPFHTVIVPHFTWRSITFFLSLFMTIASVTLFIVYACMTKQPVSWSCLLFSAQAKFFPRLRYDYEFWRVIVSAIFHGNISHFVLNIVGLQLYGYFVEWYYGKWRFCCAVLLAALNAHLMSCLTDSITVSSTASGILYTLLSMKAVFFFKYRQYEPMAERRMPLYGLLALIASVNLIVLFIGSNVDYGSHVSGIMTGILCGLMFYHPTTSTCRTKTLKYSSAFAAAAFSLALVLGCFLIDTPFYRDLNPAISDLC